MPFRVRAMLAILLMITSISVSILAYSNYLLIEPRDAWLAGCVPGFICGALLWG